MPEVDIKADHSQKNVLQSSHNLGKIFSHRYLKFLLLFTAVFAIPVTLILAGNQQDNRSRASDSQKEVLTDQTSSQKLVGVITDEWWGFQAKRYQSVDQFRLYMQSLKSDYGANMAVLNIIPTVFAPAGATTIKGYYPNVTSLGVSQIVNYLKAAKLEDMKVNIILSTNCVISKETRATTWRDPNAPPPSSDSPWWPDCPSQKLPENNNEKQFAAETGKYYYNVISEVEKQAEIAGVADTIALWTPEGEYDLGSAELRSDINGYVGDMSDLTRVGWPRMGEGAAQKTFNPKSPLASYLIFAFPFKKTDGSVWGAADPAYANLKTIYSPLTWVSKPFDYLNVTYDSRVTDLDKLISTAASFGIPKENIVLTDFRNPPDFIKAEADVNRINPKITWLWAHAGIPTSQYKDFITKIKAVPSPTPSVNPVQILNLSPVADAYVRSDQPKINFGKSTLLVTDINPVFISFFRFDLTQLSGKTITKATLRLKVENASGSVQELRRASLASWDESTINYSNKPIFETEINQFYLKPAGGWIEVDAIGPVKARKGGPLTLGITSETTDNSARIYSRESSVGNRPELVIEYR